MKVAFLDRDGTINKDYTDEQWSCIEYPEILEGAIDGMKYLIDKGFRIIIITNQYIIGEGYIDINKYNKFTENLLSVLNKNNIKILDIFFCPHSRLEKCNCCKPNTGLIEKAKKKYPNIDIKNSIFCGDSISDLKCSEKAGIKFYGIDIGENAINSLADLQKFI